MIVFFLSSNSRAEWNALLGTAGFFGQYYLGGVYQFGNSFQSELSVGSYVIEGESNWQLNGVLRYTCKEFAGSFVRWRAIGFGAGFIYAFIDLKSNNYFSRSPKQYPDSEYYEQTAFRGLLELSTAVYLPDGSIGISYYLRFLDKGLAAYYDDSKNDLRYYTSSGLGLLYKF